MKKITLSIHPTVLMVADSLLASIPEVEEEDEGYIGSLHDYFDIDPVEAEGYESAVNMIFSEEIESSSQDLTGESLLCDEMLSDCDSEESADVHSHSCAALFCSECFTEKASEAVG